MIKKLQDSQIVRYILTGGMTTGINYLIYTVFYFCGVNYLFSNTAAWLGAVIFAYIANRTLVFRSEGERKQEFIRFFSLRFMTLLAENLLLFLLISCAGLGSLISKITVSVITVVLNYGACKYGIFNERSGSHE